MSSDVLVRVLLAGQRREYCLTRSDGQSCGSVQDNRKEGKLVWEKQVHTFQCDLEQPKLTGDAAKTSTCEVQCMH